MYQNYIFDLYGTLVDIHTNEKKAYLWKKLSLFPGVPEMLQRLKDAGKKVFLPRCSLCRNCKPLRGNAPITENKRFASGKLREDRGNRGAVLIGMTFKLTANGSKVL